MLAHLDAAYNLACWLIRDATAAGDAVREAYRLASQDAGSRSRGRCERAWLLGLVRAACHARLGRRSGSGVEGRADAESPDTLRDDAPASSTAVTGVDGAIAALPLTLRECIVLRDIEGLSYATVARIVDAPVGTVQSRLMRARNALQDAFRTDCGIASASRPQDGTGDVHERRSAGAPARPEAHSSPHGRADR